MMTKMIMMISTMMSLNSSNPIKLSLIMLMMSSATMMTMKMKSGSSWMPSIIMIMFTGGIVMMFMILSSLSPNEKSMKPKIKWAMMILIVIMMMAMETTKINSSASSSIKWMINSETNLWMLLTIMTIYFLSTMKMMSGEKMSMKSNICW